MTTILPAEHSLHIISKTIFDNQLYIFPLYSIREGGLCSCGKENCTAPGKHPLFKYNWKIIASNESKKINGWFQSYNKINYGLATGRYSSVTNKYLIVIDVDKPEHEMLNQLPETFCYRTGSGGWHLWYWSKYPIKNSVSVLAEKVDVRGTDGYVVIPPSKHKKGIYTDIKNLPISDLPESIIKILLDGQKKVKPAPKKKIKESVKVDLSWSKESIIDLKEKFKNGVKVPEGVRNVVMHRLLSSDRAKGAQKEQLENNAYSYLQFMDNPETISVDIVTLVESVVKYPIYNNNSENVNKLYIKWLMKNKYSTTDSSLDELEFFDNLFFSYLKEYDGVSERFSLNQLMEIREKFLKNKGIKNISKYKPQLFAQKLTKLGYKKHRTASANFWNISLDISLVDWYNVV